MLNAGSPAEDAVMLEKNRRLSLTPEAVLVETRTSAGGWSPIQAFPFGEIRAVYRYQAPDWSVVAVAGLLWGLALTVIETLASLMPWRSSAVGLGVLALTVLIAVPAVYRFRRHPRRMLVIDGWNGTTVLPNRDPRLFASLAARLTEPAPKTAATPPDTAPPEE